MNKAIKLVEHCYTDSNDALSNNTKFNYLVNLTLTFVLKLVFSYFVAAGA